MGLRLIKEVGKKNCDLTGEKRSTSYLLQSISIAIQRGNAESVNGTVYNDRKLNHQKIQIIIFRLISNLITK